MTPKLVPLKKQTNKINDQLGFIKMKASILSSLYSSNEKVVKPYPGRKYFAKYISHKGFVFRLY